MKGAPELVEELRKNQVPMAIATSSQQDAVEVKRGGAREYYFREDEGRGYGGRPGCKEGEGEEI